MHAELMSRQNAVRVFLASFLFGGAPLLILHGMLLFGFGSWEIRGAEVLVVPGLAGLVIGPLSLPFLFPVQTRSAAMVVALSGFSLLFSSIVCGNIGNWMRMQAFAFAAERATPLVAAIKRFETENARPPSSFAEVVPHYLPALPKGLPPLELVSGEKTAKDFWGNPWVLQANVGTGILNWDVFVYFPLQNYPKEGFGGVRETVKDWAYYHE